MNESFPLRCTVQVTPTMLADLIYEFILFNWDENSHRIWSIRHAEILERLAQEIRKGYEGDKDAGKGTRWGKGWPMPGPYPPSRQHPSFYTALNAGDRLAEAVEKLKEDQRKPGQPPYEFIPVALVEALLDALAEYRKGREI